MSGATGSASSAATPPENAGSLRGYPPISTAGYGLFLLMMAAITSLLDRFLVGLLIEPIRAEMAITDTQASLLQGFAFALFYALVGLPLGRIVDRSNRRNLVIAGVATWSLMTVACGLATSYGMLFFARVGVGIGEAVLAPAAYSMITDYFRPRYHGRALAGFTVASTVGAAGSYIVGAMVLEAAAGMPTITAPMVGELAPWRITFIALGAPGFLVALLLATAVEPARQGESTPEARDLSSGNEPLFAYLREHWQALAIVIAVYSTGAMLASGIVTWAPTFLARQFDVPLASAGLRVGITILAAVLLAGPISGGIADSGFVGALRGRKLWLMPLGALLACPCIFAFGFAWSPVAALAWFGLTSLALNVALCSGPAILQDIVPNKVKGQATAIYWFFVALIGYGGGATSIALINDYAFPDVDRLGLSMICVGVPGVLIIAALGVLGRSTYHASLVTEYSLAEDTPHGSI